MEVSIKVADPNIYEVTLLTIYDKSEISNVTDTYTKELIRQAKEA